MAAKFSRSSYADEEEDYIDIDLILSSENFLYCFSNSSPKSRDFEFQMASIPNDKEIITSSADELFYKGQLLPLYRSPRLQMIRNLLESATNATTFEPIKPTFEEENHQSYELKPEQHFIKWSFELSSFINKQHPKDSWSKKMRLVKPSVLVQKLKASTSYLKSLFSKSACNLEAEKLSKLKVSSNAEYIKIISRKHDGNTDKEGTLSLSTSLQRRSFSGAIKRHSPSSICSSGASSSSSSSSFNLIGFQEFHLLKRSCSATEIEGSIEAAIAHRKKSQQNPESRNKSRKPGSCSM